VYMARMWKQTSPGKFRLVEEECDNCFLELNRLIAAEGESKPGPPVRLRVRCTAPGCEAVGQVKGMCFRHYARWRSHGDPLGATGAKSRAAIEARDRRRMA
jgi:hypothetical protein